MGTAGNRWAVVMSRGAGFSDQVRYFVVASAEYGVLLALKPDGGEVGNGRTKFS